MSRYLIVVLLFCMQSVAQNAYAGTKNDEPKAGTAWTEPKTGMEFVWVPSGCFQMGGTDWAYQSPVHKVCVQGFWMGKFEVTQAQYSRLMGANPSKTISKPNPVDTVSWDDAVNFSAKMSEAGGIKVRLPTEAEWEYACRAGHEQGKYCGDDANPNRLAIYKANSYKQSRPTGHLSPNDWGLYDMSGNVWEWVQDCWHENFVGAPADGKEWKGGECPMRVVRGGSWCNDESYVHANFRYGNDPDGGECSGFRVVRYLR